MFFKGEGIGERSEGEGGLSMSAFNWEILEQTPKLVLKNKWVFKAPLHLTDLHMWHVNLFT